MFSSKTYKWSHSTAMTSISLYQMCANLYRDENSCIWCTIWEFLH